MATVQKFTRITAWRAREAVQQLGDVTGMQEDAPVHTVLSGRAAIVRSWFDEATGDGYEMAEITLHFGEV